MKKLLLIILTVIPFLTPAFAQEGIPVFVSGADGYRSYRIPAIISLPNGDLLAFAEGRVNGASDFGNVDIVMKRSTDEGRTWSALQVVVTNDTLQAGNPAPVVDLTDPACPGGRIFLFYNTGNRSESQIRKGNGVREVWYKTSSDGGGSWSAPVNITLQVHRPYAPEADPAYTFKEDWRSYANTPGHAMQFTSGPHKGRIYVAANHSAGDPQPHFEDYVAHGFYTDDHGKTFHLSENNPFPGSNEATAAEISGGRLMMNIRNQRGDVRERIVSVSSDGGATWDTTWFDAQLPDPVCEGSILTVGQRSGNAIVVFSNNNSRSRRDSLTLRISYDDGMHWDKSLLIDKAPPGAKSNGYTAYSDLVPIGREKVGVLYEQNGYQYIIFKAVNWKTMQVAGEGGDRGKPALVPLPQKLSWSKDHFPLYMCRGIVISNDSLQAVAEDLQEMISGNGFDVPVIKEAGNGPFVELRIGNVEAPRFPDEAYRLNVGAGKISLTANTLHGLFNGIQTLRQLMQGRSVVDGCRITDWPSFSWRGYMVDVGRNYQSVGQLKQQIEVMARYKLNVFHFHLTENIAWRLQIKQYPQLTAPQNMQRNKGQYYSIAEMKDLIRYCRKRFITLVPEIDMPGHSDAFTRTFGVDMQTEKGLSVVKNILSEVCDTYDVPYIHIGADEVKVTNKDFIPEVVKLIRSYGKRTIGWDPGGNYGVSTIRQLWKGEGPRDERTAGPYQYIDSRDLYLNHMDPLSGVVSIFERKIGGVPHGDSHMAGGEICLWNDIRAKNEKDILLMNAAYPFMLAFAERSWRGGGYDGFRVDIGADTTARAAAFAAFEKRLLDQKRLYFKKKPFPYVKQANIRWKLFGPFRNNGDTAAVFWPEKRNVSLQDSTAAMKVSGGTIWLRHFFAPQVTGWLPAPHENTTWYGYTRFYSEADTTACLWIGFYNPSRSHVVSTPQEGSWDKRGSSIRLNGRIIPPPQWARPGRDGSPEAPLIDEDYEYREPVKVHFQKGWNEIMVKLPVESFRGKDWQHPVKWMFTVVPVHKGRGVNWYADEVNYQVN